MITLERIETPAFALRVCPDAAEGDDMPDFVASGVLEVDRVDPSIGRLLAFHGDLSRRLLRELLDKLLGMGITHIHATRKDRHRLPFSTLRDDGVFITDLVALRARVNRLHNDKTQ